MKKLGRTTYVGRDKNQGTNPTCSPHAVTALMTQDIYERRGEVIEFSVPSLTPTGTALAVKNCFEKICHIGISEEGKETDVQNIQENRYHYAFDDIKYVEDMIQILEEGGHVLGSIGGFDTVNNMDHAMYLLYIEYDGTLTSSSIVNIAFQNSWGSGVKVFNNVNLGGFFGGRVVNGKRYLNQWNHVYLVEPDIVFEMETGSDDLYVNGQKTTWDKYGREKGILTEDDTYLHGPIKNGHYNYLPFKAFQLLGDFGKWVSRKDADHDKFMVKTTPRIIDNDREVK
jgi:hypothetical protein